MTIILISSTLYLCLLTQFPPFTLAMNLSFGYIPSNDVKVIDDL